MARHDIPFDAPSATNGSMYLIDPREIEIREEYSGRHEEPEVDDLIADFLDPKIGQIEPCVLTKEDRTPILIVGSRRWRAAIKLTNMKAGPFDGVFKLKCTYFRGTPLECFALTVRENLKRKDVSPTCDGWNITRFRNFGMSDEDIAVKVYGRKTLSGDPDVKWIQDRAALIDLTPEALDAVTSGRVKSSAIVALAKMKKQAQRDLVKDRAAKITTAAIKRAEAPPRTEPTAEPSADAPASQERKKPRSVGACIDLVQQYINMDLPSYVCTLPCAEAVHKILGELYDEMSGN